MIQPLLFFQCIRFWEWNICNSYTIVFSHLPNVVKLNSTMTMDKRRESQGLVNCDSAACTVHQVVLFVCLFVFLDLANAFEFHLFFASPSK